MRTILALVTSLVFASPVHASPLTWLFSVTTTASSAAIFVVLLNTLLAIGDANAMTIDFIEPQTATGVVSIVVTDALSRVDTNTPPPTAESASANFVLPRIGGMSETVIGAMLEPSSTPEAPVISDLISLTVTPNPPSAPPTATVTVSFLSDTEGQAFSPSLIANLAADRIVVENGTLQTVASSSFPNVAPGFMLVVRVQSDVPESSTLLLLGSAFIGLGVLSYRRTRDLRR
jgi:hypothetical protein